LDKILNGMMALHLWSIKIKKQKDKTMKQIKLMAAATILLITAASCTKSKTDIPAPPSPPIVEMV